MTPQCLFYMGSWVIWCILTDWLSVVWSSHPSKCCPYALLFSWQESHASQQKAPAVWKCFGVSTSKRKLHRSLRVLCTLGYLDILRNKMCLKQRGWIHTGATPIKLDECERAFCDILWLTFCSFASWQMKLPYDWLRNAAENVCVKSLNSCLSVLISNGSYSGFYFLLEQPAFQPRQMASEPSILGFLVIHSILQVYSSLVPSFSHLLLGSMN